MTLLRPLNTVLWLIGPDDAPTAIEYEQSDGRVYLLCRLSDTDATGIGMLMASAARSQGMEMRQSLESRLPPEEPGVTHRYADDPMHNN